MSVELVRAGVAKVYPRFIKVTFNKYTKLEHLSLGQVTIEVNVNVLDYMEQIVWIC